MEDHYKFILHGEKIEKICFVSKIWCNKRNRKQAFYFQIVRTKKKSINAIIEPLYEGWVYRDQLKKKGNQDFIKMLNGLKKKKMKK